MVKNFKETVMELCDEIDRLYPAVHIEDTKNRVRNFWNIKAAEDRIPYVVMDFPCKSNYHESFDGWEMEVVMQLESIIAHRGWDDDYIPQFSFGIIQALVPAYFGCQQIYASNSATVEVLPIIHEASDVYKLKPIGYGKGTIGGDMLDKMSLFNNAVDGRIILSETDMQGPFSVASQMWGIEKFLIAIYDEPQSVHALLDMTTDAIIEYLHLMFNITEGNISPCHCMPCTWMDKECGVCVSEDLLAVISPDIVEEFISPYLSRIGEAFGGVLVHTCGSMNHSIDVLSNTAHLIGVNCSTSETDLPRLIKDGGKSICYLNHSGSVTCGDLKPLTALEQMEVCVKSYGKNHAGMAMISTFLNENIDPVKDGKELKRKSQL